MILPRLTSLLLGAAGAALPAQQPPANANQFNPRLTIIGNSVGRLDDRRVTNDDGDAIDDRFNLREVEVDFRAAIDPIADGVLILAAEAEAPGEYEVGVEEGYIHLKGLPGMATSPLGLRLRIGRIRPRVGSFNSLHTHDLPQTTRPFSLQTFLGEEGYVQNGVEATFDLPAPRDEIAFGATVAVLNGGDIGVAADNAGEDLAFAARLHGFFELGPVQDLDLGLSLHQGRRDAAGTLDSRLYAVDAVYRWQPAVAGDANSFVAGAEAYYADLERAAASSSSPWGGFVYAQYQLDTNWYVGARADYTEALGDDTMETRSYALFATYYASEFLRFRGGWERFASDDPGLDGLDTGWVEFNFVFGAHPPHPYWVHR